MKVAIISIGNELLRGDIANTNAQWLAAKLSRKGIQITKILVVGDELESIRWALNCCSQEDRVILTGGLGPTHDDLTRQALAAALGLELELNQQAAAMVEKYGRAALIMARLPKGAIPIPNPVGAAPGLILGKIIALPGVPAEMQAMFSQIEQLFQEQEHYEQRLMVSLPEILIKDVLAQAQLEFGVKIGSYPKPGLVEIVISGEQHQKVLAAKRWIQEQLAKLKS